MDQPTQGPLDSVIDVADATPVRRYEDLPAPRGVPYFGNALQVKVRNAHLQYEAWAREFGPSVRLRMGSRRILITHEPMIVNRVLRDRPEAFQRPKRQGALLREMGFDEGLFFANDDVWKAQRRMVMSAFNPEHVRNYFPSLLVVTARLRKRWQLAANAGRAIPLNADLMRYTVDAIAGLAFGSDVNTLESDGDVIQQHLNRIFPALNRRLFGIFPYWRYVKLRSDRELDASAKEVKLAIGRFIAAARLEMSADPALAAAPKNLLQAMLAAADRHDSGMTDRDVAGNVLVMLLAGEDTTANTMTWLLHLLSRHPPALERVQAEVRAQLPGQDDITLEHLHDMPYLDACIQETMRLKPVAPLLPVQAVSDVTVAGLAIPKDTFVVCLMRTNAVSDLAFDEPHAFMPERWLPSGEGRPVPPKSSMPFGSGPRVCPGRYLATLEIKLAIAMLLSNFEIDWVKSADGGEPSELLAFAMGPSQMQMKLRRPGVAAAI